MKDKHTRTHKNTDLQGVLQKKCTNYAIMLFILNCLS